jgi:uncharacterized membrane protein YfcA
MTIWQIALVLLAGFCAGAVNSVAGGGSFFSFPALLAVGIPPVIANASNSVALWPASLSGAWVYRHELKRYQRYLIPMGIVSFFGGIGGALLLLKTKDAMFSSLIPWLLLFATLLFTFSTRIAQWLRKSDSDVTALSLPAIFAQLLVAIYGGFFGAGMGILMLASLALSGHKNLHEINAIKNLLSAIIYSVTLLTFILAGSVSWPFTLIMLTAATAGGYFGANLARRIPQQWLRHFIIVVGFGLSIYYFQKTR